MVVSDDERQRVLKALENPDYEWRTVDGIVGETGLSPEKVQLILSQSSDDVVRSSQADSKGRPLFTTRHRYYGHVGFGNRVLSVLTDRIR
jgi:hypothetical protein